MKALIHLMVCVSVVVAGTTAQKSNSGSALQSLVDAERAFARASEEQGTRPAFLAFIAEDGILFRPTAVIGKKWMQEHPLPPSEKRPLLKWQPAFADIALAGDMGYTFGPWEYKEDIKDEKPVAYGHFATVWKRQADGSWKFVIDHGISHAQPQAPTTPWQLPANYKPKSWKPAKLAVESARNALLLRDREFSGESVASGFIKAFHTYAAAGARLFLNNNYPFVGTDGVVQAFTAKTSKNVLLTWQPLGGDVSQSEDLGYTYGTYSISSNIEAPKGAERGNYLHVWRKHNGAWKVVLDVAVPLPPEVKN